jgi:hypothetical protein
MRILDDNVQLNVHTDNNTLSLDHTDVEITHIFNIYLRILLGCVFVTLILLAFVGNTLVCVAIFWDRQLREQTENLFLVSLAFSDALLSVLVIIWPVRLVPELQSDVLKTVSLIPIERTSMV